MSINAINDTKQNASLLGVGSRRELLTLEVQGSKFFRTAFSFDSTHLVR